MGDFLEDEKYGKRTLKIAAKWVYPSTGGQFVHIRKLAIFLHSENRSISKVSIGHLELKSLAILYKALLDLIICLTF